MRRFLSAISFLALFSIAILSAKGGSASGMTVNAQDFDFSRAYQDYLYTYNLYRESHTGYLAARGEYQTYKTLTAQNRALEATRLMLKNRAEALRTFLVSLRIKLVETTGVLNYQQNLIYLKLDSDTAWLSTHKDQIGPADSIDNLLGFSGELEKKYPNIELLAYQAVGLALAGKENSLRGKVLTQIEKTDEKIIQMKREGEDVEKLIRWLAEAKKKVALSEEKQKEGEAKIKTIKETDTDKKRIFGETQAVLEEANQQLKEAISYLIEIISEAKYE